MQRCIIFKIFSLSVLRSLFEESRVVDVGAIYAPCQKIRPVFSAESVLFLIFTMWLITRAAGCQRVTLTLAFLPLSILYFEAINFSNATPAREILIASPAPFRARLLDTIERFVQWRNQQFRNLRAEIDDVDFFEGSSIHSLQLSATFAKKRSDIFNFGRNVTDETCQAIFDEIEQDFRITLSLSFTTRSVLKKRSKVDRYYVSR